MPTEYQFCRVCRQNHDQGKGHRFATKHKQRLDALLKKTLKDVQEVRFFLKNAIRLKANFGNSSKFWCHFCEQEIHNDKSGFACEQTIRHLASKQHLGAVKKFWFENGGDVSKQPAFYITYSDFGKWEEACTALAPEDATDLTGKELNNIHSERSVTHATSAENVSQSSVVCGSSLAVKPLSILTDQSFLYRRPVNGKVQPAAAVSGQPWADRLSDGQPKKLQLELQVRINGVNLLGETHAQTGQVVTLDGSMENRDSRGGVTASVRQTESALGQNLTTIRAPALNPGQGNVHSGALPPWLKASSGQQRGVPAAVADAPNPSLPLSRTQQGKLAKLRNPNRVGAAWAEKRRAEMERERRGELVEKSVPDSSAWLPRFGRVWQSGSRRETRKEFEAEKRSEGRWKSSAKSKRSSDVTSRAPEIRPYVSKRLRTTGGVLVASLPDGAK
ncbi:hypothetical protein R1flu_020569 [Riccia fluitans]|uniref:Coiled-coil domain-containing protein 84 n=1 Tax=Riccia fluitans TaxID=41844 RepID=A0ABD1ZLW6_9MARC